MRTAETIVQHTQAAAAVSNSRDEVESGYEPSLKTIQPKLAVGAVDDPCEKEADNIADAVMRMPEQHFIQRKCADCEEEEKVKRKPLSSFIRKKTSAGETLVSDHINNQISSGKGSGDNMDDNTRSFMENRFGVDFGGIKIHTGDVAVSMNRDLGARAFTVGNDIYFNKEEYRPDASNGKRLLAHELTHVVQQTGKIQRQTPAAGSTAYSTMTQQQFVQTMQNVYGFKIVREGLMTDQVRSIGLDPARVSLPGWTTWSPGQASIIYQYIIEAYTEFSQVFGGFPQADTLYFFDIAYDSATLATNNNVVAEFGNNELLIYRGISGPTKGLPIGRSVASGRYRNPPPSPIPYSGSRRAAPIARPTLEESTKRFIFHELGHGINSIAMQGSPALYATLLTDYINAIGRYPSSTGAELYDIGVPQVRTAIGQGLRPPAQYMITASNWNDPNWIEQPISEYMVSSPTGPAGDDFAEAVMTFVSNPALLRSRSPHRYSFLNANRGRWQPGLSTPGSASSPITPATPVAPAAGSPAQHLNEIIN